MGFCMCVCLTYNEKFCQHFHFKHKRETRPIHACLKLTKCLSNDNLITSRVQGTKNSIKRTVPVEIIDVLKYLFSGAMDVHKTAYNSRCTVKKI